MPRTRKNVLIALKMSGIAGQDKLAGIFRRLGDDHCWNITLLRTARECTRDGIRAAIGSGCDGFIVSIPVNDDTYAPLAASGTPTVVLDIHDAALAARKRNIVFVRNSSREIGNAAADLLLSTGRCRSYAFVHNPMVMEWGEERCRAFREMLSDRGLWCRELADCDGLRGLKRPTGVCAANDDCGFTVLEWCRAHRVRVPEDMLVIGINNDSLICENARPRLTSVQPDFEQEGFLAADALEKLMRTPSNAPETLYVGVKKVERRESTADVSSAGKLVQKALAYIDRHALDGICVADVVHHLKCSRRLADLRFKELQGCTILNVITERRLDEVKKMLVSTRENIDTIATNCGYSNPNYLRNLFKSRFGMSMREFRCAARFSPAHTERVLPRLSV